MNIKILHISLIGILSLLLTACSVNVPTAQKQLDSLPDIYPDYTEVTVPQNIAPLRFMLQHATDDAVAVLSCGAKQLVEEAKDGKFLLDETAWKNLLQAGPEITVRVYEKQNGVWAVYKPFTIHVMAEDMDSHLAYRLIPPGYEPWYELGIYQRDLTSFTEKAILENKQTDHNCMNCHSFPNQNPDKMLLHMRAVHGGTYLVDGQQVEVLNGKVNDDIASLVYPSWHPSGDFIAFSTNTTRQTFLREDRNRIEVYDEKSDVLVYDVKQHQVLTDSLLFSKKALETFPTFSPDGKTLYFCTAEVDTFQIPRDYKQIKYNLCRIGFNAQERTFDQKVDTLYSVKKEGRSAKFPRISPDGKHLVFTVSDFGNFSIWHHDADLFIYDLEDNTCKPLAGANSQDTESYHSWSSNSHWLVFSSRREDGLYTRPYICYIDAQGNASKPFLLPQEDPEFYHSFMFSYNIPEFIKGEVTISSDKLIQAAKEEKLVPVSMSR